MRDQAAAAQAGASGAPLDVASPRVYASEGSTGNRNGHIIRWREDGAGPAATTFTWDLDLFGAQATVDGGGDDAYYQATVDLSGLCADNDFCSPDGLWFSQRTADRAWIQADDSAYTDTTNGMMLAAIPGQVGDGSTRNVLNLAVPANGSADQTVITKV